MCASQEKRVQQAVGVLLGGSGRVRAKVPPPRRLAALLRPAGPAAWADRGDPVVRDSLAAA